MVTFTVFSLIFAAFSKFPGISTLSFLVWKKKTLIKKKKPMWEKDPKKRGYMYMYNWFILLYSGNQHNIVKQLYSDKN